MNRKTTRRALVLSLLSLLLCCSMLVGTTFAWFTDSVTSGNNRIVAGNLDVELYYQNDTTTDWTKVGANTNVFKTGTLWEPGHTEVVKLKVTNEGTLALKYQLGIAIAAEIGSINKAGEAFKLSDYIMFGIYEGDLTGDRAAAVAAVQGNATEIKNAYSKPGTLEAGADTGVLTMVVWMPENVGNEANYMTGKAVPEITLGIDLFATQKDAEVDSFGPDYDADIYPNPELVSNTTELLAAIADSTDGEVTTIILQSGKYDGDIKITQDALGRNGNDLVFTAAEGATPVFTGTITLGYRKQGTGAAMWGGNVTFEGVTFDHAEAGKHSLQVEDVKSLNLIDCTIIGDGEYGIGSASGNATGASKIVGCTFENASIQGLGNFCTGLVIDDCTFTESRVNIQGGNGVTIQNCTFDNTLTTANVGDSFYLVRTNSTPVTIKDCVVTIDSELTEVATSQTKWGAFWNRGSTNWTIENVEVTLTDAAKAQTELLVTKTTSTGVINTTNLVVK